MPLKYDAEIIVIGSGPGGAVTAALLAEAGRDVMIVEEGEKLSQDSCELFSVEEMETKYRCGGLTATVGLPRISYVEGKVAGGGSEINSGLYHRTPEDVLEKWRKYTEIEDFTVQRLLPFFETVEKDIGIKYFPAEIPPASKVLQIGAEECGLKPVEVPRWWTYFENGKGKRNSMSTTYLPRAEKAGARIICGKRAVKLSGGDGNWLVHLNDGSIKKSRFVFVCAGAIHTPFILKKSGLSKKAGESFKLHPTAKVAAFFDYNVNYCGQPDIPVHQVMPASNVLIGGSISSPPYLYLALRRHPETLREIPAKWKQMFVYYVAISPYGSGSIKTIAGAADPLVTFKTSNKDLNLLAEGLKTLCRILFKAGAVRIYPAVQGWPVVKNESDISKLPASLPNKGSDLMTIHLFSSCPMGKKDEFVLDEHARVKGFKTLYVNDASMLPGAPGINPQGTIMALAHRNINLFL